MIFLMWLQISSIFVFIRHHHVNILFLSVYISTQKHTMKDRMFFLLWSTQSTLRFPSLFCTENYVVSLWDLYLKMLNKQPASICNCFIATLWSGHTKLIVSNFLLPFLHSKFFQSFLQPLVQGTFVGRAVGFGTVYFQTCSCLTKSVIAEVRILTRRFFFCCPLLGD